MLQTPASDRRPFWIVLTTLSAIAGIVAWNVL
jgi:hypothetical protein